MTVQSLRKNFARRSICWPTSRCHPSFPEEEIERAAGQPARPARPAARGSGRRRADGRRVAALYGADASVRLHRARHRGVDQGHDARRPGGVLEAELRARTTRRWSSPGRSARRSCKPLVEKAFGAWAKGTPRRRRARHVRDDAPRGWCSSTSPGAPQTQLRVADDRRAAIDARLRRAQRDERDARRAVLEPHQPEPARGARLHVRRELAVRVPQRAGPFWVGSGVRTDVTAPAVAEIIKELKRMRTRRSAPTSSTMAKDSLVAVAARRLRDQRERRRQPQRPLHLRPRARLLHDVPGGGLDRHRRRGAGRRAEVPRTPTRSSSSPSAIGRRSRRSCRKLNLGAVEIRSVDGSDQRNELGSGLRH